MFTKFKKVISGCLLTQMFFSGVVSASAQNKTDKKLTEKEILEEIKKYAPTDGDSRNTLKYLLSYIPFYDPYVYSLRELEDRIGTENYIKYIGEIFKGELYNYNRMLEVGRITNKLSAKKIVENIFLSSEAYESEIKAAGNNAKKKLEANSKFVHNLVNNVVFDTWDLLKYNFKILVANPNKAKNLSALGLAATLWFSSSPFSYVTSLFKDGFNYLKKQVKRFLTKPLRFENYDQRLKELEKRLKSKVIGQDKAIELIIKRLRAHFANVALSKKTGVPYNNGMVLYFVGPSGVGKTLVMDEIKEFFDLDTITMNMPLAVEDKGNNAVSVISRFLKPTLDDKKREIPTKISTLLSYGYPTLLNIDEVDKMRFLDYNLQKMEKLNSEGRLVGSSIDEAARQFMDTSNFAGYELKNSVLIMTSNETKEGLFNSLEQSLVDRYKDCIVSFEYFDSSACEKFLVKGLEENLVAFYKKLGVDLVWDECSLKQVAKSLADKKASGRTIKVFLRDLVDTVGTFYKSNNTQDHKLSKMVLCYSEKDGVYVKGA